MREEQSYWEAVTLAAIASGRFTGDAAAQMADKMINERNARYPFHPPHLGQTAMGASICTDDKCWCKQ